MQKLIDDLNNLSFTDEVGEMAKSFEEYQKKKAEEHMAKLVAAKRDSEPEQEEPLDFDEERPAIADGMTASQFAINQREDRLRKELMRRDLAVPNGRGLVNGRRGGPVDAKQGVRDALGIEPERVPTSNGADIGRLWYGCITGKTGRK